MAVTVDEKRTCTTCRELAGLLTGRGVGFDRVEFPVEGPTEPHVREPSVRAAPGPPDALRMREPKARDLVVAAAGAVIAAVVEGSVLLHRPVVVNGDRAGLARPPERVLGIL